MRAIILGLVALAGSAHAADVGPTSATTPLTSEVASKARYLIFADRGGADINRIEKGLNDSVASVEIIFDGRFIRIPASTVSVTDKPRQLKTNLSAKEILKLN